MRRRLAGAVPLLGTLALVGCADQIAPTGVDEPGPPRSLGPSSALSTESSTSYLVIYRGKPGTFESRVVAQGGEVTFLHPATSIAFVEGLTAAAAAELLSKKAITELVMSGEITNEGHSWSTPLAPGTLSADAPSGATNFPSQWHLRAIHADDAWAAGRLGSSGVTAAIVDSGIDYTHPDLMGRVDLSRSASFVPGDDALVAALFPSAHPIADLTGHGTHVAAIVSSNGVLAAGVTSKTTLMGVKVCGLAGCPFSAVLRGVLHAVDNGADVINISLAGSVLRSDSPGFASLLQKVLGYAEQEGATLVVGSGNEAIDLDRNLTASGDRLPSLYAFFCDSPVVLCVSATGPTSSANIVTGPWTNVDAPAPYSNFGNSAIDVAAPGGTNPGWIVSACSQFAQDPALAPCRTTPSIVFGIGTSMAAPHAAGVASLLVEDLGRHPDRIRTRIGNSSDRIVSGSDPRYGKGRINTARALGL